MANQAGHRVAQFLGMLLLWLSNISTTRATSCEGSEADSCSDDLQFFQSRIERIHASEDDKSSEKPALKEPQSVTSPAETEASLAQGTDAALRAKLEEWKAARRVAEEAQDKARQAIEAFELVEQEVARLKVEAAEKQGAEQRASNGDTLSEYALAGAGQSTTEIMKTRARMQKQFQTQSVAPHTGSDYETYDISINSFKRDAFLDYSLKEYQKCHRKNGGDSPLAHIWVIWNDNNRSIPENLKAHARDGIVTFWTPSGADRISNRFTPLNYTSNAVFHVDDDMLHMCQTMDDMFAIWQTDPDGMVGTSPRSKNLLEGGLDCWACPIIWGEYNIVFLTKGAFVHKRFFEEYWKPFWKPIRDIIDEYNCAEDFLMSAVHAASVGPKRVYAITGSVNKGDWIVKETRHLTRDLNMVEQYRGLNSATWGVRGFAMNNISSFLMANFPKQVEMGHFTKHTKQWWRSNEHPGQSCREQTIPCYNRAWDSCAVECDTKVRGNMACFTGDSACYAGLHMGTPIDWSEQDQVVCVGNECVS